MAAVDVDLGDDLQPHTPNYSRRVVLLLVDSYDLATIAAIRYAKSLHPSTLRAVHFSLDNARSDKLRPRWLAAGLTITLELAECPAWSPAAGSGCAAWSASATTAVPP
jgi:hypothetical protein